MKKSEFDILYEVFHDYGISTGKTEREYIRKSDIFESLMKRGFIKRTGHGDYTLTQKGEDALEKEINKIKGGV